MTKADFLPDSISWHEGMLLSPQHFQEMDRRIDGLFRFHTSHLGPYHWGVINCQIDDGLLAGGALRILQIEAVMPDGMIVRFKDSEDFHLEITLNDHIEELKSTPRRVYLALVQDTGGVEKGELRRYRGVEGDPVDDVTGGGSPVRIPRKLPAPKLIFGKPSKLYTAMPLFELAYKDNTFTQTNFCPPVLHVTRDLEIGRVCFNLVATLRRKAKSLSAILSSGDRADETIVAETEFTLRHLVGGLPMFEAILNSERPHPFNTYLALVELMAHIVHLSNSKVPPILDAYDHNSLVETYRQVEAYMTNVLDERIQESFSMEIFKRDGGLYSIPFKPAWEGCELVLGFNKEPGTSDLEAANWVSGAIVGSRRYIHDLRQRRVLGADRDQADKVSGLVPPEGTLLFPLEADSEWIQVEDDLVVSPSTSHAGHLKPLNLTLYIRNSDHDKGSDR